MKHFFYIVLLSSILLYSCEEKAKPKPKKELATVSEPEIVKEYGFTVDDYTILRDTVRPGDSFGKILFDNGIDYAEIQQITDSTKEVFDTRRIRLGAPYTLFKAKDSINKAQAFVYEENAIDYVVINFNDSISAKKEKKPVTLVEKTVYGEISNNLSTTFDDLGLSVNLVYKMSDIYAWTIDFFHLQPGDRFKLIYTEKFINDTIPAGYGEIKASWFEYSGNPIYAFRFKNDSIKNLTDYYDEEANNLRRAFLKGPLSFSRISSRYNLKRRIAFYGNRIRPHKGTDFAGAVGTPIMATADGTVINSEYRGGNGNYVKIRHNSTYDTQYLHMSKRKAKVGDYVRQGDVIGYVGMTGNTSGPHVCYRFWKNGKQVDPFKVDLPTAEPLADSLRTPFYNHIAPLKEELDAIHFEETL
ncbi:M23 family metallopeptidase [Flavimarina sp. Hel_I_48]|uniref:M23 family metallopeptidase n=1 Tax=Flavimarina sp. Hel_I_48 TaxID=1392488 RepID=UPI0004DF9BA7|nr:peptidoglycan DD-metalloendopeptidase family protein [Flavimarina sp. Hel_I_48]